MTTVDCTFASLGDLPAVRRRVRRAATPAGLRADALQSVVLAVHEAAVFACRVGERIDAHRTCSLRARVTPGQVVVDIDLPAGADGPALPTDHEPLYVVRRFCDDVSWHHDVEASRLHVVARVGSP